MSEIQNRAVQLLKLQHASLDNRLVDFRFQMLKASLALYRSLGGTTDIGHEVVQEAFEGDADDVATSVGNLMMALAALSHLQDMDMMQAAYNTLDGGFRQALASHADVA